MNNYRGITVTAVIGKTFENCPLEKLNLVNESELQFGFTKGLFPLIAGLLMSEAKYEVSQVQKTLFIGLFDVQSAFDVVQHIIPMDNLFDQKITLALWSIINDMYSGLTTRVKWKGEVSNTYPVLQEADRVESCLLICIRSSYKISYWNWKRTHWDTTLRR